MAFPRTAGVALDNAREVEMFDRGGVSWAYGMEESQEGIVVDPTRNHSRRMTVLDMADSISNLAAPFLRSRLKWSRRMKGPRQVHNSWRCAVDPGVCHAKTEDILPIQNG